MFPKTNFSLLLFTLLKIFFIIKSYNINEFICPNEEELLYIDNSLPIIFNGTIKIIKLNNTKFFKIYSFSSENIEQNEKGEYTNYKNYYEIELNEEIDIEPEEKYVILLGSGYVSFSNRGYINITYNDIQEYILPYDLNCKFFKLVGPGNGLEIIINNDNIIYFNDQTCTQQCFLEFNNGTYINIVNYDDSKDTIIKLLFTERKSIYNIDKEKGDIVKYIFQQSFKFEVSSYLANEYLELKEGILLISGNPIIKFLNETSYIIQNYNLTHQLYYIRPYSNETIMEFTTNMNEGEISGIGVNPTIEINFPEIFEYKINKGIGPQYLRIIISNNFDENYIIDYNCEVAFHEGYMFNENNELYQNEYIINRNISKKDQGKIFTAIYNTDGEFSLKFKKIFDWISTNEYQVKYFSLNSGEEALFKFEHYKSLQTIFRFENGYYGNNVELYLYFNEDDILYNPNEKKYDNYYKNYSTWKEVQIGKSIVYLIIKAQEKYSDYISFRSGNIALKDETPEEFNKFNDFNFICYSLNLDMEDKNAVDILSNTNKFIITLNKNNKELQMCNKNLCHFNFTKNTNYNYYIYIKNLENEVDSGTKLYILQRQNPEYHIFENLFISKYFLSNFEYKFKLDPNLVSNIAISKELVINYESPKNPELYNIILSYNNQTDFNYYIENLSNVNYIHYYYNLIDKQIDSEIIITIKGTWSDDLFLPPEKVGISFGGPFLINYPGENFSFTEFDLQKRAGGLSKLNYLKVLPELKKVIAGFKPDILHAHFATSYGLLGALSGFHPFILSVWEAMFSIFRKKVFCISLFLNTI